MRRLTEVGTGACATGLLIGMGLFCPGTGRAETDMIIPGLVPGFALHRELAELVSAGMTPYEALRTSTTRPYEYLGELDRAGTIAVGKHPDLLLVDGNPLQDIAGASKVAGVFVRGRWLDADEIRARMGQVKTAAKAPRLP